MAPSYKSSEYINDSDSDLSEEEIKEYEPPRHFNKVSASKSSSSDFPSGLKDKEIWLIKTPRGFPIKELKKLPISFTNDGNESFKVSNLSYQVNEDLNADVGDSNNKHTIFTQKKKSYKPVSGKISRFYSIHEVVQIPEINLDKVVVPRENVEKIKRLRMRHFPTGYGADDYEFEDEEEEDDVDAGKVLKKAKTDEKEPKEKKHKKDKKDKKEKKKSKKEKH
ncbi:RPA34 DNA-directed RNA polymerase I subunit RPA34 [Candida maltosa Xu316]